MSYKRNTPSIEVIRKDGTVTTYHYTWSANVGSIRKGDALLINAGEAIAFYPHHPTLTFTRAVYYKDGKKWFLKSSRSVK
jgi:hypothetical protein